MTKFDYRAIEREELLDEIERLRAALQRIVVENADIHCEEIARAALEGDDECK